MAKLFFLLLCGAIQGSRTRDRLKKIEKELENQRNINQQVLTLVRSGSKISFKRLFSKMCSRLIQCTCLNWYVPNCYVFPNWDSFAVIVCPLIDTLFRDLLYPLIVTIFSIVFYSIFIFSFFCSDFFVI